MTEQLARLGRRMFLSRATAVLLTSLIAVMAAAQEGEVDVEQAAGLIKETTARLLKAVGAQTGPVDVDRAFDLVAEYIEPHVDLERAARRILGKHWRKATADQRRRFVEQFRILLLRTYAVAIADNPSVDIEYLPARRTKRPGEAIVPTRIPQSSAPSLSINYRLHGGKLGWKLFDVSIEGVSLVRTYRSSFAQRVKKSGIDALIEDMAKTNRRKTGA
ncbi:MAG: hypothetical protein GKR94_13405 [Gammaproteobacteria bacterium]|nr:hypothetical protein [Gammaproteobacteria bacterium]